MTNTLTQSCLTLAITLSLHCVAMDQKSVSAALSTALPDIVLTKLTSEEAEQLQNEYKLFNISKTATELRVALFGIVGLLAVSSLEKRDPSNESNAQEVYKRVYEQNNQEPGLDYKFLYGILLAAQKPAQEDKHPFRQFYTPVEQVRKVLKDNDKERDAFQVRVEEISRQENGLTAEMAILRAQMDALQERLDTTRKNKQKGLTELTLIIQANNTLQSHVACHGVALQERRNTLQQTINDTINMFINLKKKHADEVVIYEKTSLKALFDPLPAKIEADILSLWYCVHYLQRIKSPDGQLSSTETWNWRRTNINHQELGITNYADYLKAIAQ